MNLASFNIKADIKDSIFLAEMVIQDTTNAFMHYINTTKVSTLCALPAWPRNVTVHMGHALKLCRDTVVHAVEAT
jgi:hypothetical protein